MEHDDVVFTLACGRRSGDDVTKLVDVFPTCLALGNQVQEAATLIYIGKLYDFLGNKKEALTSYDQALQLYRPLGDRVGEATVLHNMGLTYSSWGDPQKALEYYDQALLVERSAGDQRPVAPNVARAESANREPATGYR